MSDEQQAKGKAMKYGTRADDEHGMIDRPALLFGPGEHVWWQGRHYQVSPRLQWMRSPSEGFHLVEQVPPDTRQQTHLVEKFTSGRLTPSVTPSDILNLTLRGYETNGHPGIFVETVWGSRFRDHDFLDWRATRSPREGEPDLWYSGDQIIQRFRESRPGAEIEADLARRIAGEHLQDFYVGDASMLSVGDTMRVLAPVSHDVSVTEEDRARRHPCAFSRGYLPVFWGFSNRAWPSQRPWFLGGTHAP